MRYVVCDHRMHMFSSYRAARKKSTDLEEPVYLQTFDTRNGSNEPYCEVRVNLWDNVRDVRAKLMARHCSLFSFMGCL